MRQGHRFYQSKPSIHLDGWAAVATGGESLRCAVVTVGDSREEGHSKCSYCTSDQVMWSSSQNPAFHSRMGAALSDPNTGREVSSHPEIYSTQPPLLPSSLCDVRVNNARNANTSMLMSVSMETRCSHQYTQEIMLWRREWGWEG